VEISIMSNYSQFIGGGAGESGVSGYSGRSGYSGSAGTSGFSGQPGPTALTNTYIGFGNASNLITGSENLTWSGSVLTVGSTTATIIGNVGEYNTFTIHPSDASSGNYPSVITIRGGRSNASSAPGGALNIQGGPGPASNSGDGGPVSITGGAASTAVNGGDGGDVNITGGTGAINGSRFGGSIVLTGGIGVGTGGAIVFRTPNPSVVTERARFTPTGALSFGSTGTAYGTAGQVLTSNGNAPPSWQGLTSGYSGADGASGYSGFGGDGVSGFSGYSGVGGPGVSGYSGATGTGTSGYSGVGGPGISGYSGTSGWSGTTPDLSGYVTLTGTQTLTNKTYTGVRETKVAMAANDVDMSAGNYFTKTITTSTVFTASNVPASGTTGSFIMELTNAGSQTITWFTGTTWASGVAPTLTSAGVDILGFYTFDGGTTWRGLTLALDIK